MRIVRRIVVLSVLATVLVPAGNADAATRTFPGCRPTLVKCINSVAPGSTIILKTNALIPIPDDLLVKKGMTLVAAKGFKPRIGRAGPSTIIQFELSGSADVTIRGIRFEQVAVHIEARSGTGHTIVFERNRMLYDSGINGDRGYEVFLTPPAKGTITVRGNNISASGSGIEVGGSGGAVTVTGNVVTAPVPADSQIGIGASLGGKGTHTVTIANNLVHHVVGCNCGIVTAIYASAGGSATANARILNNTVADLAVISGNGGHGIAVFTPNDTGHVRAWLFNNIVYNTQSFGYRLDDERVTVTADANAGFGNPFDGFGSHDMNTFFTGDPAFFGPGAGDYRLSAPSPLVNAGETCIPSLPLPRADLAGKFRIAGIAVDLGAYERGSSAPGTVKGVSKSGGSGANNLMGTSGRDVLCGNGGNDIISGFGGGDFLFGGSGKDKVFGGAGSDRIDIRDGKEGNDAAYGEAGSDVCLADAKDKRTSC